MLLMKDERVLLDTSTLKLNFGITEISEFKGSKKKQVITESDNFDDAYVYEPGTYQGGSMTITCVVRNTKVNLIENVFEEANRIVFDKDSTRFREFYIEDAIEYQYVHKEYTKLIIPLYLKAYRYNLNKNSVEVNNTIAKTVINRGNVKAAPVITIYGQGTVTFSINGEHHNLHSCTGHYVVDCRNGRQNVYDEAGNAKNITSQYDGDFPLLNVGNNVLVLINGTRMIVEWEDRNK